MMNDGYRTYAPFIRIMVPEAIASELEDERLKKQAADQKLLISARRRVSEMLREAERLSMNGGQNDGRI